MRSPIILLGRVTIGWVSMLVLYGCYPVRSHDLPGQYTVSAEWGRAELKLFEDGKLEEAVSDKNGLHNVKGNWRLLPNGLVERRPCLLFFFDDVKGTLESCTGEPLRFRDGHVGIGLDPDFALMYKK